MWWIILIILAVLIVAGIIIVGGRRESSSSRTSERKLASSGARPISRRPRQVSAPLWQKSRPNRPRRSVPGLTRLASERTKSTPT